MAVKRFDLTHIDGPVVTQQGYLKANAYATRAGVFNYILPDGSVRRELRHPDEVFRKESLDTLAEITLTNEHPDEPLTAENTKKYSVGFTGDRVDRAENLVGVKMTVTDKATIDQILTGNKQELSCGYMCDVDMNAGEWNGQKYDAIQKNIKYNHLAVVQRGRAGPEVRVRLDSGDAIMQKDDQEKKSIVSDDHVTVQSDKKSNQEDKKMAKLKIDAVEYEMSEALAAIVSENLKALESAKEKADSLKKELDANVGKADAMVIENKKLADEVATLKASALTDKQILERADALNKVHSFAKSVLGDTVDVSKMDIAEIKKSVVQKHMPNADLSTKSDSYLDGVFDTLIQGRKDSANEDFKKALGNVDSGKKEETADQVRARRMKEDSQAWNKAS